MKRALLVLIGTAGLLIGAFVVGTLVRAYATPFLICSPPDNYLRGA